MQKDPTSPFRELRGLSGGLPDLLVRRGLDARLVRLRERLEQRGEVHARAVAVHDGREARLAPHDELADRTRERENLGGKLLRALLGSGLDRALHAQLIDGRLDRLRGGEGALRGLDGGDDCGVQSVAFR